MHAFQASLNQLRAQDKKALAVLIDPDKCTDTRTLEKITRWIHETKTDFIFIGGSLLVEDNFEACVKKIRSLTALPLVLFPGSSSQISTDADALLLLSLISGRNAELLIGQHVAAAPRLKASGLEIIPTGYMIVDCGKATTASYITQTFPIPYNKPEIAATTALAGEMLGLRSLYLDGGSGADRPVSAEMIAAVRRQTKIPLIVGGGIRNEEMARNAYEAGADVVVVGTAFEEEPELLFALSQARQIS